MIHSTEKSLAEHGDKVDDETKKVIEDAASALKEVAGGDDVEAIKEKTKALTEAAMKLGEAIYKAEAEKAEAEGAAEADASAGEQPDMDEVVDADFEEVKDDEKKA